MNSFLENLKKAVEVGDFNSEAAKKINEISELADKKSNLMSGTELNEKMEKRIEEIGVKTVSEDEVQMINSEYERKMEGIMKLDKITQALRNLIEMDELIDASVSDLLSHVDEVEDFYQKDFDIENKNPIFVQLKDKLIEIKSKYSIFTNK